MDALTRRPLGRILAVVAALVVAALAVLLTSAASADATPRGATTRATTNPVPGLNGGESATFSITDTGRSIVVVGRATGMQPGRSYVSLLYPDGRCSMPEPTAGFTLGGAWQGRGDGRQYLYERYDGAAYAAVKGNIGSISVRDITAATNAGAGNFTLTATARACAPVSPQR